MPKGICIPHRALCNHVRWARQAFDLFSGHVALQMANLNFDISVSEIFDTLTSGGRLVLAEPREYWDVITLIDLIIQHQITHLQVVPSVLRMIVENGRFADCITLQHVLCGGEILPADLALQFVTRSKALLHNLYGPSETCIDSTHMIIPGADPGFKGDPSIWRNRPISIGRPIANVKIYILDPYLEPVPIGVSGELYIAGVSFGLGYLNDPLRTAESFIPNPFGASGERLYRTGDLVSYAWDGSLRFLGRIDEQVKLRGYRIELGEIENVLVGHPLVHQAIAGIHRDVSSSQASERDSLVVYIVPEQASSPTIQELRQYLRGKLPGYMLPSEFIFLEAMPLLPNGKVDRRALAALKPSQLLENEYIAPRTPFEQVLAEIWSEIFEVEQVGLQDNFFELGGHSLLAMRLYSRIEAAFGLDVPIGLLYDSPSLGVFSTSLALLAGDPASLNSIAPLLLQSAGPNEDEARKIQMEATSAQTEKLAGNPRQTEQETVLELVTRLRKQNIRIWTANDELKYSAPPGRMTLDLRAELSTRKLEIISFLQQQQENGRISKMVSPDKIPLSFAQQRLFFIQQFEPASYVYNLVETFRILGELDLKALEGGINQVVRRHSSLRTLFQVQDSQPVQIVQPSRQIPLRITDLRYLPEKGRLGKAVALLESDCCHPFDLSHDTLIRPMLIQLSEKECLFQITMHHIITDGWSMDIFFRELSQLYNAKQSGKTANLKDIQVQYTDFTLKQREHLSGAVLESLVDYWKKQLANAPVLLSLPADRPRPTVQSFKGARLNFSFPHELTGRLRSLSLEHNVTMFMLLLAAFKVLIYRYTGQEDVLVGVPIANRTSSEIENLIGFFVNTLLLRTNLSGSPSFKEILRRVRRVSLEAYQYQDLPFEKLVEVINPPRIRSHSPLFQVSLAFQTAPSARLNFTGLDVEPFNIARGISHFDWTLFLIDRAGELSGAWEYNSDIFDRTTIERALGHFLALLDDAADHPLKPIGRLQMLTRAESRQITQGWNNTQVKYAKSACLHQVFQDQVKRNPGALAMTSIDAGLPGSSGQESLEMQSITYSELNARANQLAHHLRRLGVGRGTLVGLCVQRSIELVVGILGILKAGGAYVPLDPDTPVGRMEYILQETRSTLLLTQASLSGQLPGMQITTVYLDSDQGVIGACSSDDLPVDVFPDDPAYVIFTSGSTGKPKGVSISHYNVLRLFQATHHWFNFDEKDVWTLFHSFAFDFSVWEFWGALLYGGRLVVVPFWTSRTPDAFAQLISEQGVTVLNQTPSAFLPLLQITRFLDPQIISSLRLVIFGGEALNIQSLRPWFDRRGAGQVELVNMYGITETTVHVTYRPITQNDLDGSGSVIGVPIPDLQTYLLDQDMQPVPVGVPGEIYVGGAGLSQGYLNRPELTAERFVPNPFNNQSGERLYRSGDLARYLPNGDLEYLGRRDHQVKIRGFRIELGEIEALLSEYPGVQQVVVLLRQDHEEQSGIKSSQLVAYLVAETELSASGLRHYLKTRLPEYMLPAAFVFMPDFPLTSNGKVDRDALPKPASLATSKEQEYLAPRTAFEQVLSRLWAEVLGIEQVGLKDNFFQLGGHSLLAMRLIYRFEELFNMRLEINMLFDIPVVEDFANFILENSANREYLEKVAELLIELTDLSEEEARLILIRKQQEKGGSEKSER